MTEERRSNKRVRLNLPTRWQGVTGQHEGRIEDLSIRGCFINTLGAVDVGEIISLMIKLPSEEWLPLRGKVVSSQQRIGFSLSFSILDGKEQRALAELVKSHA